MSSFLGCRREISYYMKDLTFFELDEEAYPPFWPTVSINFKVLYLLFSFYMKELIFFELDEGVYPPLWQTVSVLFFVLFSTFSVLQR